MRSRRFLLFAILSVFSFISAGLFIPIGPPAAQAAGSGCDCSGSYVAAASKAPSVSAPAQGSTSPGGTYTLSVSSSSLTVKDKSGHTLLNLTGLTADFQAGFSPNDNGFAVWSQSTSGGHVALYNLASKTPSSPVWTNDYTGTYSVGFSPKGTYFLVAASANAQYTSLIVVNATTGAQAYNDQVPGNTNWGFSPDEDRLAIWTGNNPSAGSTIILYDLAAHRQVWRDDGSFGSVSLAFSPHGAYLAAAAITNG
ncbi:MAG TPA: WD40 repeat domain-containing protein, partial [Chloroflexota bacterium]|nr:WD40 repeat domain-containing protein [Chloroflexota bacterium]